MASIDPIGHSVPGRLCFLQYFSRKFGRNSKFTTDRLESSFEGSGRFDSDGSHRRKVAPQISTVRPVLASRAGAPSLVTPRFATITLSALCYFTGFAMLLPTLPVYVEQVLNGSKVDVGIVVGAFGASAALVRPFLGRLGDRKGRRILLTCGAALTGLSALLYTVWLSIPLLVLLRLVSGVGEAGAFVGAATSTQDLAPDDRRGEASSYFSLAIYVGLGFGPFLGELIDDRFGFEGVVRTVALLSLISVILAFAVPAHDPEQFATPEGATPASQQKGFLHQASVLPGLLLTLSLIGFVGFTTFMKLWVQELEGPDASAGTIFLLYAVIVITFRLTLADLPDRLGPRRGGTLAFGFISSGLTIFALVPSLAGVYLGTAVLACGVAFNYPALFLLVMAGTEPHERSHSVASFGFFFDIAGFIGAPLLGLVIRQTGSERWAFAVGAACAGLALVGLRVLTAPSSVRPIGEQSRTDEQTAPKPG